MIPNFEPEFKLRLKQINGKVLKEKQELLEKWRKAGDPRSLPEYCEAAGLTPFATGVMHVDESSSGATTPRARGHARI